MKFFIPLRVYDDLQHKKLASLVHTCVYGPFTDDEAVKRGIALLKENGEKTEKFLVFDGRIFETRVGEQGRWIGSVLERGVNNATIACPGGTHSQPSSCS